MNKRNVFLVLCAALLTASLAGCAEPAPEDIEDFGEKTKVSRVFTVSNTDEWAAAVKAIDGGGNDRNYVVNVTGPVNIPGLEGSTFSQPHSGVNISLRGTAPDAALVLSGKGSLIVLGEGEHLVLRDITLKGGEGNTAMLVYVGGGSTLTMKAGAAVSGNENDDNEGNGVYVAADGNFMMQDGTISGNTGGGVYVRGGSDDGREGIFVMQGGTISGNAGSGVSVWKGAFIMEGGKISGNTAPGNDGGGVSVDGTFTMKGGEISGNTSGGYGGGVAVGEGVFTMEGGEISGNTARRGGGISVVEAAFIMEGGEIFGNAATYDYGGGVYMERRSAFSLNGGIVRGSDGGGRANKAWQGASLYRSNNSATYSDGSPIVRGDFSNGTLTGR
jgi:hypothetical protein